MQIQVPKQVVLADSATDKAIVAIQPSPLLVGDKKKILISGQGFEIKIVTKTTGQGQNKQTALEETQPTVLSSAPGVIINDTKYISPTTLRGFIEIPKNCPAGNYDIVVVNPNRDRILGQNKLEIQGLPTGQVKCKHCQELMLKPVAIPRDANDRKTWFCPHCNQHQAI